MNSWQAYGKALKAYWQGDKSAQLNIHMDDGSITKMPLNVYFRNEDEMPELETYALSLCYGRILDVGAGTGPHSKILLSEGNEVSCIDVAPEAVEILKSKGIKNSFVSTFLDFKSSLPFDTLLLLMNGIGIVQNLDGLKQHLLHAHSITHQNSQILLDSSDLRFTQEVEPTEETYFGEITYQLSFKEVKGDRYQWLYVDPKTLQEVAKDSGWNCQIIFQEDDGSYLSRLTKLS